jgi:Transcriptional regulator PadR-like family
MGTIYRHTQVSRATVGGMGIAWAAMVWWSLRVSDPVLVTTAVLVGCVLVLFSTLTVIVRDGAMDMFFGPGLIRRRIPLRRIREVRVVKTPHRLSDVLRVEEGSLYPALHRMEEAGWIRARTAMTERKRAARAYEITAAGQRQLAIEVDRWRTTTNAINYVLKHA